MAETGDPRYYCDVLAGEVAEALIDHKERIVAKKIKGYNVVTGRTAAEVVAAVEHEMRQGWQPWGNLVVPGPGNLIQAVVLYGDEDGDLA